MKIIRANTPPVSTKYVLYTVVDATPNIRTFLDVYGPKPGGYTIQVAYLNKLTSSLDNDYKNADAQLKYYNNMRSEVVSFINSVQASASLYCNSIATTGSWKDPVETTTTVAP